MEINELILYTTQKCPKCEEVKRIFEKENITFTIEQDVSLMREKGIKFVPIVEFDGKLFNYEEILKNIIYWKPTNGRKLMSDAKFYEGYSRYNENESRYETWEESVNRVIDMHRYYYKNKMTDELSKLLDEVKDAYSKKLFLGAQRALQFGGEQLLKHHGRLYNCFHQDTKFVTNNGVKSFKDFKDGDKCIVRTHTGEWRNAIVKSYGEQDLYKLVFRKGNGKLSTIIATKNHRWILKDGSETTEIKIGDKLYQVPDTFKNWEWETASDTEKLYWCYGMVYGDGTVGANGYSKIRLCGYDKNFESRFLEMGFKSSSSASLKGDIIISTGSYNKKAPNPDIDSPEMITAFVSGYLQADGYKNCNRTLSNNPNGKRYNSIQSSEEDHIEFIRKCFPIAGVYISSEKDLTGQETNYGIRPYTVSFSTYEGCRNRFDKSWVLHDISPYGMDKVWCLEVEEDCSFILNNGIVTGNCSASYCDRPNFFGGFFYLLLCGCGVGFSVQKHHVEKIPNIQKRLKSSKTYVVPDTIEGWANTIDVLLSSYFVGGGVYPEYEGKKVYFDLSNIRPKGSFISGGFKAPGSEPLRKALDKIEYLIEQELKKEKDRLSSIVLYDICMHIADAVISGGVRRSATICLFSKDDSDMINAKTGNWFETNPQRSRSNNSVVLLRNETSFEEFEAIMKSVKEFGEPGFIWTDNKDFIFNPCFTGDMKLLTQDGYRTFEELNNKEVNVINYRGEVSKGKVWCSGEKEVIQLTLSNDKYIKCTPNHVFMLNDGSECEAKDLKGKRLFKPIQENNDFEKLYIKLGFIQGDGSLGRLNSDVHKGLEVNIGYRDMEIFDLFDIQKEEGRCSYYLNSYNDILYNLGFDGVALPERVFPITYNDWNLKQKTSFIRGCYSANGSIIKKYRVAYKTTCKTFAIQLKKALENDFGITANITTNKAKKVKFSNGEYLCKESYDININKFSDTIAFYENIGFEQKYKMNDLVDLIRIKSPSVISIKSIGVQKVYDFSEPITHWGIVEGFVVHNCVEVGMKPVSKEHVSGFQLCNLTEINGAKSIDEETFFNQCKYASILGTLQAGYTNFKFLKDATKEIVEREALIGVGITGMMNNPHILFNKEIIEEGARVVKHWNKVVADMIGINQAARTTVIKPSGNSAVLLECSSGIHGEHSERYLRHVQFSKDSEVAQLFMKDNSSMCEDSVWNKDRDVVVAFPIIPNEKSIFKKDLLGTKQLEYVKMTQQTWIEEGTNVELCTDNKLRHNVSNTITVDNWDDVTKYIYDNRNYLCGVSLLSSLGDKAYPQAPFTEILTTENIVEKYGQLSLFTSALIEAGLNAFDNDLWKACSTALGYGEKINSDHTGLLKRDFVRRFNKFAQNFNNAEECANCLKDVYNLHKFWKINKTLKNIDWVKELSKKSFTEIDTMGAVACSGGQCEV